jgi:hypothetical protein
VKDQASLVVTEKTRYKPWGSVRGVQRISVACS